LTTDGLHNELAGDQGIVGEDWQLDHTRGDGSHDESILKITRKYSAIFQLSNK